jgi:hypothetical protein
MRELGSVFQLRRTPSVSSIWLHWSFNASKSAILGGFYAATAVVFGRCLVEGNEGAHNLIARGWRCACGRRAVLTGVEQLTAWPQQEQAATIPLDCKVY